MSVGVSSFEPILNGRHILPLTIVDVWLPIDPVIGRYSVNRAVQRAQYRCSAGAKSLERIGEPRIGIRGDGTGEEQRGKVPSGIARIGLSVPAIVVSLCDRAPIFAAEAEGMFSTRPADRVRIVPQWADIGQIESTECH